LKRGRGLEKRRIINAAFQCRIRRAKLQTTETNQTPLLAYADDIDIVGKSLEDVRDAYLALEAKAAKIGLKIKKQNTKYMIAAGNGTILDARISKSSTNLCTLCTAKNSNCFYGLRKHLRYCSETWVLTKMEQGGIFSDRP
jgi:hypothetical protein